jgi:hypothetical protein
MPKNIAIFRIHGKQVSAPIYFKHIEEEHVARGMPAQPMAPYPMAYPIKEGRKEVFVSYQEYLDWEERQPKDDFDLEKYLAYYKLLGDAVDGRPVLDTAKVREIVAYGNSIRSGRTRRRGPAPARTV